MINGRRAGERPLTELPGQGPFTCGGCGIWTHGDIAAMTVFEAVRPVARSTSTPGTAAASHACGPTADGMGVGECCEPDGLRSTSKRRIAFGR